MDRKSIAIYTVTTVVVYLAFKYIMPLILPFILAYFLSKAINPLIKFLCDKMRFSRLMAAVLSLLSLLAAVTIGIYYLIKTIRDQLIGFLINIPKYLETMEKTLDSLCNKLDQVFYLTDGSMKFIIDDYNSGMVEHIRTTVLPNITEKSFAFIVGIFAAMGIILIVLIATILIAKEEINIKEEYKNSRIYIQINDIIEKLIKAGTGYIRAQGIIALITAVICTIGLSLIKNEFSFLLGIGIGIFDAFPVLGSGLILVPWSIISLIKGDPFSASILIVIYLVCQIMRQVLEPKLLGDQIGIAPIFTLISIYVGIRLFSLAGFFLGPIALIIIITVGESLRETFCF